MLRSALLNVMIGAARKAARSLKRDFGEVEHLQVSLKGPANFVTAADRRAEEILRAELAKARPGYGFLGEEGGRQGREAAGDAARHRRAGAHRREDGSFTLRNSLRSRKRLSIALTSTAARRLRLKSSTQNEARTLP